MLYVRPAGVRKDQLKPWGGPQDSGVSGDPIEGDGGDRQDGHRVQGQRRDRAVQSAEEPGPAGRRRRQIAARAFASYLSQPVQYLAPNAAAPMNSATETRRAAKPARQSHAAPHAARITAAGYVDKSTRPMNSAAYRS